MHLKRDSAALTQSQTNGPKTTRTSRYRYIDFDDSTIVKTPKLHIGDTGLACALLGVDAADLEVDQQLLVLGQLLERFVFHEMRRQAICRDDSMSFYHYRDRAEVDIVIERGTLEVADVEVKASGLSVESCFTTARYPPDSETDSTQCRFACSGKILNRNAF